VSADRIGFPGRDCRGNPHVLTERLPFLKVDDVVPYLVQKPQWPMSDELTSPPGRAIDGLALTNWRCWTSFVCSVCRPRLAVGTLSRWEGCSGLEYLTAPGRAPARPSRAVLSWTRACRR
jgi:hypothetical protein